MDWIHLRTYTTWYHTYQILYYEGLIKMTPFTVYKYRKKNNRLNNMKTLDWNTITIYAIIYHTYRLLHCKGLNSDHK